METNKVEYKAKLTDSLEKEIVAFLKYKEGGIIYIGINSNGGVIGIDDCDGLQLKIKDKLKHNIEPSCLGLFDIIVEEQESKILSRLL